MNKLTKLTINKFRNVKPTTLEFRPGINVVLGKNATGKTTLLRLLASVMGADDEALHDDEMDVCRHGARDARSFEHTLIKKRVQEPTLVLEQGRNARQRRSILQRTDSVVLKKDGVVVLRVDVSPDEIRLEGDGREFRVDRLYKNDLHSSMIRLMAEQRNAPALRALIQDMILVIDSGSMSIGRMDESLDGFSRLLKIEVKSDEFGVVINDSECLPVSMSSVLFVEPGSTEATSVPFQAEFLDRVAKILGYDSASARFDVEHFVSGSGLKSVRLSNLRFFFRRMGEEVSHDWLSYGQKRLLAFFAHADATGRMIIADEIVNGLHHEWISACLNEIGNRQAFLTSQNPLLLDFLRFDGAEDVRRAFILCERVNGESGAQLVWRNPTEEEADSFFSAYQTGIQRVSDILLTKGLW